MIFLYNLNPEQISQPDSLYKYMLQMWDKNTYQSVNSKRVWNILYLIRKKIQVLLYRAAARKALSLQSWFK